MKNRGLTLFEVLLAAAIVVIIMPLLASLLYFSIIFRNQMQVFSDTNEDAVRILRFIGQNVRNSRKIIYPKQGNASSTLIISNSKNKKDKTKFELKNGEVIMTNASGTAVTLNSDRIVIDNLLFRNIKQKLNRPSVKVEFEINGQNFQRIFFSAASIRKK